MNLFFSFNSKIIYKMIFENKYGLTICMTTRNKDKFGEIKFRKPEFRSVIVANFSNQLNKLLGKKQNI